MPVRGNTFKIFIGNLTDRTTGQDLRELFEDHGTVVEADVVDGKNFGFVHMEKEEDRKAAIDSLNGHNLHGRDISVEASKSRGGNKRTKIFIGNLHKDTTAGEIRELFEAHGKVNEADVLGNYSFVHMDSENDARRAIEALDGTELHGLRLRVQESTSRVRQGPGMGDSDSCFRCGSRGHWSKDCRNGGSGRGRGGGGGERFGGGGGRFDPYGGPPPRGYERDRMMRGMRDDSYDRYGDGPYVRRPLPPMRDDPYDRVPLPPRMRDVPYERRPMMSPNMDDPYERRMPPSMDLDYMRFGRRSPPRSSEREYGRYPPPPPPPIRGFLPASDRRPF
ncbi:unnamed protein product [Meganyctiphanes norvegica]|uniref:RNA-binding protein lark n=1 Tax=Meganyctiphanes norvegica TaxID=48144 RepID=A0AAV2Q3S2_MEGNR